MESTTLKAPGVTGTTAPAQLQEARTMTPIKWWAGVGGLFIAFIIYLIIAWFASGDATPTPSGPDPVPTYMKVSAIVFQVISPIVALSFVYFLVIRPWRREGRVPFDGLFLLALGSLYWQDPLVNYTQAWASYNADMVNLGSWSAQIPGWQSPNGEKFAEPLLFSSFGYMYALFLGAVGACWAMRKAKARWPQLGKFGLVMICFGFLATFDLLMELSWMRLGLWTYGGSIPELTLFHGHYYQFPIYEALMWGGVWTVWASLRYFRDDKGNSVVERGVDRLRVGAKRKVLVRFLAIAGALNAVTLLAYSVPFQIVAAHSGPWVEDAQSRSYMMDRLCGPHTEYACAGPDIPIVKRDSARIDVDGRLVLPAENRWTGAD